MDRQRLAENREALLSVTERLRASTEPDKSAHFEEASANQQTPLPVKGTAQLRVVTFNLLCTALGTGVLAIPSVFASVGILGGMLLLLVVPAIAERTAAFMTESAESTGVALLYEIMASTFGSAAGQVTELVLALYSLGALIGSFVVLKQLTPPILLFLGWHEPPTLALLAVLCVLVLVPLSSLPSMERLKLTSIVSVLLQGVIVTTIVFAGLRAAWSSHSGLDAGTVAGNSLWADEMPPDPTRSEISSDPARSHQMPPDPQELSQPPEPLPGSAAAATGPPAETLPVPLPWLVLEPLAWMRSTPVVAFAYQFHQNVPFLFRELRHASLGPSKWPSKASKMLVAIRATLGACFGLYTAVALASAVAFGSEVQKNLLVSLSSLRGLTLLPPSLVAAVQGAMALVMVCVFPVNLFGLRVGLHGRVCPGQPETAKHRWVSAALLTALCFGVASAVNDLGALFALIGATTGTLIMFVMPSALALRLRAGEDRSQLVAPSITLMFGIGVGVCGVIAICM